MYSFIEDFDEYDCEDLNLNDEQFDTFLENVAKWTLLERGERVISQIKAEDRTLITKGNPIFYSTGNHEWIIYQLENNDHLMYICCTRNSQQVFTHVRMNVPKQSALKQWRFMHKLKSLLDNLTPELYRYYIKIYE